MTARVECRNIRHCFGAFTALKHIDLSIDAGEFAVLLGPSGCGKTTLLMILAGFFNPTKGRVIIGDRDVTHDAPAKRPTTTVFQDYALFPHMTVAANIGFGPRMQGIRRPARKARAMAMLDLVGLSAAAGKKPHELSGGQRQRVALARALAVEPDVLLLDEPLGALDLKLRRQMQDELKSIQRRLGTTFVHVTHDQEEAMAIADKIIVMNHGSIEDCGTADAVYLRPATLFSAGFMGEINFVSGVITARSDEYLEINTDLGLLRLPGAVVLDQAFAIGEEVTLGIRPEHFRTEGAARTLSLGQARVSDIAFFGTHQRCHLQPLAQPARTLLAHLPQSSDFKNNDLIEIKVNPELITVLSR